MVVHTNPCPKCGRTEIHKLCEDLLPTPVDGHKHVLGTFCKICLDLEIEKLNNIIQLLRTKYESVGGSGYNG
jgi:hypothetical protein